MIWKEAEKLELQGKKLLEKKDYKGAEKHLPGLWSYKKKSTDATI